MSINSKMSATYEELEALYRNFSGDGWTHRDHWLNRSVSYCDWYGITCESGGSRANGSTITPALRVQRIVFVNNNLRPMR